MPVRILELFSGTKSVSQAMRRLWPDAAVTSVDLDPTFHPDICVDITTWNFYAEFEHGEFDVIWASPPCTQYSRANQGVRDLHAADAAVEATFRIIEYLQPTAWFVENPASGMLATRPLMRPYASYMKRCSYCKYGTMYRKNTLIWTNLNVRLSECDKETPCPLYLRLGFHPRAAQKGKSRSMRCPDGWVPGAPTATLWRVPDRLVWELCAAAPIPGQADPAAG